nr:Ltp family lipoprotein [uncultured Agathobaculum sp.]
MEEKAKAKKPFYKRWWVWAIVIVLVIGMFAPSDDTETKDNDQQTAEQTQSATTEPTDTEPEDAQQTEQTAAPVEEPEEPADTMTMGQKNALGAAENYLSFMAFSRSGLIGQLEYDGYTTEEATYAADNCGADWNEQAAKSAESYLEMMSFSRQELIDQLVYDGFTQEQAEYGVTAAGY